MVKPKGWVKYSKSNINCSLGCDQIEDQPYILRYPAINAQIETDDYSDIFGNDPKKVEAITKKLKKRFSAQSRQFCPVIGRLSNTTVPTTDLGLSVSRSKYTDKTDQIITS